jgi:hypothetical protein
MHVSRTIAIGFLAALVVALIAVAIFMPHQRAFLLTQGGFFVGLFGLVTVNYKFPLIGTVGPTVATAAAAGFHNGYNTVRGTVTATLDADTTAVLTHNFALTTAQLAAGQPELQSAWLLPAAALSLWTFAYTDGNTITATKATTASSGNAGAQLWFSIRRPHSIAI